MTALVNVEAEAALLGALMQENKLIDRVADRLSFADFAEPVHARIYSASVEQYAKGKSVTPVTIKGYLEGDDGLARFGGNKYLVGLSGDMQGLLAPMDLCSQIVELAQRRRMAEGLRAAAAACESLSTSIEEVVSEADASLVVSGESAVRQVSAADCMDEMARVYADKTQGVTSGCINALDKALGPIRPTELVIAAGRPGMGKTAFALSYCIGAARRGHGVLFVSLEMGQAEIGARMAADMCFDGDSGVPFHAIRAWELANSQIDRLQNARDEMRGLPFQVIDAGSLTPGRLNMLIRRHARRMAANGHKLELVVVDYLQLLSADTKGKGNYETVSEVSRALKAMAKDHGVGVLALAQLSRKVEERPGARPQPSDLRDSGQIEQDADAIVFLLRPEYYLRQAEPLPGDLKRLQWEQALEVEQGKIEFIIAKCRNGVPGTTQGTFSGFYQAVRG